MLDLRATPRRILVTGAGGFIGAALTRRLCALGHEVVAVENGLRGSSRRLAELLAEPGARLRSIEGDVRDVAVATRATEGCAVVFHLAAVNGTENFYRRPEVVLDVAIRGALATMDAAIAHRGSVLRYVNFSSSEVYNEPTHVPTTESERAMIPDVRNPRFSYGGGKLASELLTFHYLQRKGVPAIVIRPHNVYGPDMGDEHVVPQFIRKIGEAARAQGVPLSSGGGREVRVAIQGDGSETRAFCHVDDFVEGLLVAVEQGADGEIFHVGTEDEISVRALLQAIGAAMGVIAVAEPGERTAGSTPRRCPSIAKLAALGYRPSIPLAEGLAGAVAWYRAAYGI
ncbi:MAG: NAD-dependent epimerase/dehydratase family protein [Deltaproteobacteria bacterium]|nr:NAD-dependent epimerase/dehydratase family protein [Deltaproteobacteria bacterium]